MVRSLAVSTISTSARMARSTSPKRRTSFRCRSTSTTCSNISQMDACSRWIRQTQKPRTLLRGLYFANGVAVSPDQTFVLVAETGKYRIRRVWVKEPKAGMDDVFIDNLPGFPDGISSNGKDKFWLALVTPRQPLFDKLMPYPFLRKVVLRLPRFLQPAPQRYSFVLALDPQGSRRAKPPKRLRRLLLPNRQRRRTQQHALLRQHRRKHGREVRLATIRHKQSGIRPRALSFVRRRRLKALGFA